MVNTQPVVMIYKRTHNGDPDSTGVFGINDCMGRIRDRNYDAVNGTGGNKPWRGYEDIGSHTLPSEISPDKPGFGVFHSIRNIQILTDTTQRKRSFWKLPASFYPKDNKSPLSYHAKKDRWKILNEEWVTLSSVARGREFVLDTKYYPGVHKWLKELFC